MDFIKFFNQIGMGDIEQVGGKNASLGEMFRHLSDEGIPVPDGFALTADAYWTFLEHNDLQQKLTEAISKLDTNDFDNLNEVGEQCRSMIMAGEFPDSLSEKVEEGYHYLVEKYGEEISFAARSSATAEDLPHASFAGQQETFLNVKGLENLAKACHRCFASLFTDRAIKYRADNGFEHMKVALSVGVQLMVRSDKACSGVLFTLDPDTGFEQVILIAGSWGLGENVVQGTVNTDEFLVFKPFLGEVEQPIISRKLGSKEKTMIYSERGAQEIAKPEEAIENVETPEKEREKYILEDSEIIKLAQWASIIEQHYDRPMDIEWAKDGISGQLYIVQARPETVYSQQEKEVPFKTYKIKEKGQLICQGIGLGNSLVAGKARLLESPAEIGKLAKGEILVTGRTDPDWDPILKKAAAIITNQGGRTSHAAIVAREVGAIAVVGTGDATQTIEDGQLITVSTVEGDTGYVYEGRASWEEQEVDMNNITLPETDVMLILGHPDQAFKYSALPNSGVGLLRMEFIINNTISIHPMALQRFNEIEDIELREQIERLTHHFPNKANYFVHKLAESIALIAAAFYPKDVIVRMSDFKSNEYSKLIGGEIFEPKEENPMIGFRGASRYDHPLYRDAFVLECQAMKMVREAMGLTNVKLMLPFVRNESEAKGVLELMAKQGLKRGENGLEMYMMVEIPSNALLAEEFAKHFDGFSIGSNDLTQLTLGADRDSELLKDVFDPFDPAVMQLIRMAIEKANQHDVKIGLCGQAPSDYPDYARFLVECGIDSISFNPDALISGIKNIVQAEQELQRHQQGIAP